MTTSATFLSPCCRVWAVYADIYENCEHKPFCPVCLKSFDAADGIPVPTESQPSTVFIPKERE